MKLYSLASFICLVAAVSAEMVYYNVSEKTDLCIRMQFNCELTVLDIATKATVKIPMVKSFNYTGTCLRTKATLKIDMEDKGNLSFSFQLDKEQVNVIMTHTFVPSKVFNTSHDNATTVTSPYKMPKLGNSYLCKNLAHFELNNTDYTTTMAVTDDQSQTFDLKDGAFGPAIECDEDKTTTPKTTTPKTTTPKTTTPKTTHATTTIAPAKNQTYQLLNAENKTCVILKAAIMFKVNYETVDKSKAAGEMDIPSVVKIDGSCPGNGSVAKIELVFGKSSVSFEVTNDAKMKKAMISSVSSTLFIDNATFPNATTQTLNATAPFNDTFADDTFYTCNGGDEFQLSVNLSVISGAGWRIQAFNLANNSFSGNGDHCAADTSSTTQSTTPTTTLAPTTPIPDPVNNYTVQDKNVVCIFMKTSMEFSVTYVNTSNMNSTTMVYVPAGAKSSGNCNESSTTQLLTIKFSESTSFKVDMIFQKDSNSASNDDNFKFSLVNVTLSFNTEDLPNALKNESVAMRGININMFQASSKGSYLCNSETDINLNSELPMNDTMYFETTMKVTNFQYMAFNTGNSTAFPDDGVTECSGDDSSNSIVPIAVGAALAGLVIIVIIAYLIGRKRSKRYGYESV